MSLTFCYVLFDLLMSDILNYKENLVLQTCVNDHLIKYYLHLVFVDDWYQFWKYFENFWILYLVCRPICHCCNKNWSNALRWQSSLLTNTWINMNRFFTRETGFIWILMNLLVKELEKKEKWSMKGSQILFFS